MELLTVIILLKLFGVFHRINQQHGCSGDNSVKSASYAINAVASRTSGELDFVFVGPTCTTDIRTIGDFAEIWKSPVIGYEPVFEARGVQELTSVINVAQFSVGGVAETLVFLMKELEQVEVIQNESFRQKKKSENR